MSKDQRGAHDWKPGLPPGDMTEENKQWFLDTFEVYFSPAGAIWHRTKTAQVAK